MESLDAQKTTTPLEPLLRQTRFEDYPKIERLEASHDLLTLPHDDWRRLWTENPVYRELGPQWPIGWVLEEPGGAIVGSMVNIPFKLVLQGRPLIAATGRAWVVAEKYRGLALWLIDEYFNQQNADLFINTTVNGLAVNPFAAFGSTRVPLGDWDHAAYWITGYRGFARTALNIKHVPAPALFSIPVAIGLKAMDLLKRKSLGAPANGPALEFAESFNARFDSFWNELVRLHPHKLLSVRTAETLAWHFAGPLRAGQAWILTASRGGLMRAYAIFKQQNHPPSGLIRMRLVDYQNIDSEDLLPSILEAALRRCRAENVYTLEHVGCALPKMRSLDAAAPYRRALPAWPYYYFARDAQVRQQLANPQAWDPSSFDGDSSL